MRVRLTILPAQHTPNRCAAYWTSTPAGRVRVLALQFGRLSLSAEHLARRTERRYPHVRMA